jgi:ubiquitin carboxyl-terminal hydrolase 47
MQQFYMIPTLRYTVLKLNDNKKINYVYPEKMKSKNKIDDNMFHQLQKLFSYLLLSEKVDYNPFGFTYSFKDFDGNPTKLFEQKDTQEFLAIFLDRLEQSSKLSEYKHMISNIFGGKNCSLITCLQCGYVSYKYEPSVFLSLEVKNMKNLNESLDKYINEEFIDGYECDGCKKRCRISKRNTLSLLPNVCIIHLQRLYYNWEIDHNEKINRYYFQKK